MTNSTSWYRTALTNPEQAWKLAEELDEQQSATMMINVIVTIIRLAFSPPELQGKEVPTAAHRQRLLHLVVDRFGTEVESTAAVIIESCYRPQATRELDDGDQYAWIGLLIVSEIIRQKQLTDEQIDQCVNYLVAREQLRKGTA